MKNKAFIFSTVLLALVISLAMFAPRVFDMSEMLGTESEQVTEDKEDTEDEAEEKERYGTSIHNSEFGVRNSESRVTRAVKGKYYPPDICFLRHLFLAVPEREGGTT